MLNQEEDLLGFDNNQQIFNNKKTEDNNQQLIDLDQPNNKKSDFVFD